MPQSRTLLDIHKYTSARKTGRRHTSLRQRDKVKDDAIAQLSDQLVSLSDM
jgi:hypothetical protein